MRKQVSETLLMVRPKNFRFNEQTFLSNSFQKKDNKMSSVHIKKNALKEFNALIKKLRSSSISVIIFNDGKSTPDAVFPNNWVTFHEDGRVFFYPMCAKNRRLERRKYIIDKLRTKYKFYISNIIDLTKYENKGVFLEGTGSMVFDHINKIIYSCISTRTNPKLLNKFGKMINYKVIKFRAVDSGKYIYHTNVMMSVGDGFAIVCSDSIINKNDRLKVLKSFELTGHEIIKITTKQLKEFAGNTLQISNNKGKKFLLISERALKSLNKNQITSLKKYSEILSSDLNIIEKYGGGGIRCMIAEIFLPR